MSGDPNEHRHGDVVHSHVEFPERSHNHNGTMYGSLPWSEGLPEGAVPIRLKGYNDELPVIDDATALVYARGLAYYIAVKRRPTPDDALTMIEDLKRYFESHDRFCLFCSQAGKPAPHEHESDDH